ncbi:hypothetical protein GGI25_004608 [Coemansia spiralis]|uniref:Uncharacterized protein n=2 Tax=Coemansia TaxID=4863 RepID=A0A9W8G588_9FUNG|nr:hypothetical protein EDC05_004532 [Coemansia umbellata]KAJ2620448.1 hypothetical protein GGI26_005018 [Coemansia sp. RSA 1358]KAJ2673623.1 hypothetical protein GGI25_004608 [Coemansia spiralis]
MKTFGCTKTLLKAEKRVVLSLKARTKKRTVRSRKTEAINNIEYIVNGICSAANVAPGGFSCLKLAETGDQKIEAEPETIGSERSTEATEQKQSCKRSRKDGTLPAPKRRCKGSVQQ